MMKKKTLFSICILAMLLLGGCQNESVEDTQTVTVEESFEDNNEADQREDTREELAFDEDVAHAKTINPVTYEEDVLQKSVEAFDSLYYFETLSKEEQKVYEEIYAGITLRTDVVLSTLDKDMLDKAFQCVLNDHPEIFYSSGYTCTMETKNDEVVKMVFSAKYNYDAEEVEKRQAKIADYESVCLSAMPDGLDEYGQVKYIFDYIVENTSYDMNSEDNQNICSVFLNGTSVCQGYAKAMQYLLSRMGYPITIVIGETEGGKHAWNLVYVDGAYYYLDATWGDADYIYNDGTEAADFQSNFSVNYDYFLVTTEQLMSTHTPNDIAKMPECVATEDNYYIREGLYFDSLDTEKLSNAFKRAIENGEAGITLKASDSAVYEELVNHLVTEQYSFEYAETSDSYIAYSENRDMNTIYFWLKR